MHSSSEAIYDIAIIGAGINGAGIARDATGRGLKVLLIESSDIGSATSSASSKLIHGGIRYLENYEFKLVAEALSERETIIDIATHLTHPMQFVMPHVPGLRPLWMIKLGLLLYDRIGGTASRTLNLSRDPLGNGINKSIKKGFVYSDCSVDDSRLVIANVEDAVARGATLLDRWKFIGATADSDGWTVRVENSASERSYRARSIINAAGPWVRSVIDCVPQVKTNNSVRLVKGSHIVVPRLYSGDHAYILQNEDRRVVFVLPYQRHYSVIGTTDVTLDDNADARSVYADADEISYLCSAAAKFMRYPVTPGDIVSSWSGVRPLFDDGRENASKVTRDYVIERTLGMPGVPMLNIYGGKLTTYRHLAEDVLKKLNKDVSTEQKTGWTARVPLPGADFHWHDRDQSIDSLAADYPQLDKALISTLFGRHGLKTRDVLLDAETVVDLGRHFGHFLYEREVRYLINHEWARTAADVLDRRTRTRLHLSTTEQAEFERWFDTRGYSSAVGSTPAVDP